MCEVASPKPTYHDDLVRAGFGFTYVTAEEAEDGVGAGPGWNYTKPSGRGYDVFYTTRQALIEAGLIHRANPHTITVGDRIEGICKKSYQLRGPGLISTTFVVERVEYGEVSATAYGHCPCGCEQRQMSYYTSPEEAERTR
jgi:hypothetical protein